MAGKKSTAAKRTEDSDDRLVWEIALDQIRPAPWNPPARMDPKVVEELAESIAQHGQQIPALLRPVDAEFPVRYELVFGHRRYAAINLNHQRTFKLDTSAAGLSSSGTPFTIKAFVRDMTEEQAMILSGIENLQRQGFSDIEEAEFFRTAGDRYGESAVKMLAEKLSVSEKYIRKRVEFLKLPDKAQQLWRSGKWHAGHMEQLLRVGESKEVEAFMDRLEKGRYGRKAEDLTAYEVREIINQSAVLLGQGKFDKAECKRCRRNTQCQLQLFGGEDSKAKCLDPQCFLKKQQGWYDLNWVGCAQNKYGTAAALVTTEWKTGSGSFHSSKTQEKCLTCDQFTTTIRMNGEVQTERCCFGDAKCHNAVLKLMDTSSKAKADVKNENAPRVEWHGEYFRQEFYREQVPQLLGGLLTEDPRRLQLGLACLVYQNYELHGWFYEKLGHTLPEKKNDWERFRLGLPEIIALVSALSPLRIEYLLAETAVYAAYFMDRTTCHDMDRQAIAEFLGVDFSKYRISEEYLLKKTKGELVRLIVQLKLHKEKVFHNYAGKRIGFHYYEGNEGRISIEKLGDVKKPILIDLILMCGVDLHGRLPLEIAERPKIEKGLI